MTEERLNVVDERGNIVGEDTRANIHIKGLLHREVNIYFYTPAGEVIFQRRSSIKDTFPNKLDTTAGGHVEIGMDFDDTAVKETKEEVGIDIEPSKLERVMDCIINVHDPVMGRTNHVLKRLYVYLYEGAIEDLHIEEGNALGFELWPIDKMLNLSEEEKEEFIPSIIMEPMMEVFRVIQRKN